MFEGAFLGLRHSQLGAYKDRVQVQFGISIHKHELLYTAESVLVK